jgi:hypothetical protein
MKLVVVGCLAIEPVEMSTLDCKLKYYLMPLFAAVVQQHITPVGD